MSAFVELHRLGVDFEDIQTFLAVARFASFSVAARRLNLAQPTVTGRIKRLEQRLGTRLFDRTTRRVMLTLQGERLYAEGSKALATLFALLADIEAEGRHERREVRVGVTMGIATVALPPLIADFHAQYPDFVLRIEDGLPEEAIDAVLGHRCDLAVIGLYEPRDDVCFTELLVDECVVAAPRGHALIGHGPVPLADVLAEPLLIASGNPALLRLVTAEAERRSLAVSLCPEARDVRNVMTSLAMVAAGLGVLLPPRSLIPPEYAAIIGTATLADWAITPRYGIVTAPDREPTRAARAFIAHLRGAIPPDCRGWPAFARQ